MEMFPEPFKELLKSPFAAASVRNSTESSTDSNLREESTSAGKQSLVLKSTRHNKKQLVVGFRSLWQTSTKIQRLKGVKIYWKAQSSACNQKSWATLKPQHGTTHILTFSFNQGSDFIIHLEESSRRKLLHPPTSAMSDTRQITVFHILYNFLCPHGGNLGSYILKGCTPLFPGKDCDSVWLKVWIREQSWWFFKLKC